MPLIHEAPTTPRPLTPTVAQLTSPDIATPVLDTTNIPVSSITAYISGPKWRLPTYFSQVLANASEPKPHDIALPIAQQQYLGVDDLLVVIENPTSSSTDPATGVTTVTGSMILPASIVPRQGDMFLADGEPGRLGIFQVTAAVRLTHFTGSLYRAEFSLKHYVDIAPAVYTDLRQKVVKTVVWVVEDYVGGGTGLIASQDYSTRLDLRKFFYAYAENYVEAYYSTEHATLLVPGQATDIYDPYVIDAVFSTLDFDHTPALTRVSKYAIDSDDLYRSASPYHAVISTNPHKLKVCFTQVGLSSTQAYAFNFRARTVACSDLDFVVTPKDGQHAQKYAGFIRSYEGAFTPSTVSYTDVYKDVNGSDIPVLTAFNPDEYLCGSKVRALTGYDSLFEKLLFTYFTSNTVNLQELKLVCLALEKASPIECFYYFPVVFALIRHTLKY